MIIVIKKEEKNNSTNKRKSKIILKRVWEAYHENVGPLVNVFICEESDPLGERHGQVWFSSPKKTTTTHSLRFVVQCNPNCLIF